MDLLRRLAHARVLDRLASSQGTPAPEPAPSLPPARASVRSAPSPAGGEQPFERVEATLNHGRRPTLLGGCLDRVTMPDAAALARDLVCMGAKGGTRAVFLDTETTGLGGASMAFVIGLAWVEPAAVRVVQWTLSRLTGEAEMLADVLGTLRGIGPAPLVSFNGSSFDVPLLRLRARRHDLCARVLDGDHVDLLHGARRLQRGRGPDCRLATLERELLGLHRRGDIDSAQIPAVFWTWLQSPDHPGARQRLRAVQDHNLVDLVSLPALAGALAQMIREPADLDRARRAARHLLVIGAEAQAREVLARAVEPGLSIPEARRAAAWREAALELANLERRAGDRVRAAALWQAAYQTDPGCPFAAEAWAKQLEHVDRAYDEALRVARGSRLPCERRIARLERRLARAEAAAVDEAAVDVPAVDVPAADVPAADVPAVDVPAVEERTVAPMTTAPRVESRAIVVTSADLRAPLDWASRTPDDRGRRRSARPSATELLSVVEDDSGARLRYKLLR